MTTAVEHEIMRLVRSSTTTSNMEAPRGGGGEKNMFFEMPFFAVVRRLFSRNAISGESGTPNKQTKMTTKILKSRRSREKRRDEMRCGGSGAGGEGGERKRKKRNLQDSHMLLSPRKYVQIMSFPWGLLIPFTSCIVATCVHGARIHT